MGKTLFVFLLLVAGRFSVMAQAEIKGTVTDAKTGTVMPGVSVRIKGYPSGVETDSHGNFRLNSRETVRLGDTLVLSYVGYVTRERFIGKNGNNTISISLPLFPDEKKLQEVVVVAYGSQEKSGITGNRSHARNKFETACCVGVFNTPD